MRVAGLGVRVPSRGAIGVGEEINGYTFIFGGKTSYRIVPILKKSAIYTDFVQLDKFIMAIIC